VSLLQTYCLVILATFAIGFMLIQLQNVLLPLLFALFLVSGARAPPFVVDARVVCSTCIFPP
jgi:hypothetical protein